MYGAIMSPQRGCEMTQDWLARIDHIGIAATDLDASERFWRLLGLIPAGEDEVIEDQEVRVRMLPLESDNGRAARIELLQSTSADGPIARFIEKRGIGIQQVCLCINGLDALLDHLDENGVQLIDRTPRLGAEGQRIAFVHPSSTGGVLVELTEGTT